MPVLQPRPTSEVRFNRGLEIGRGPAGQVGGRRPETSVSALILIGVSAIAVGGAQMTQEVGD